MPKYRVTDPETGRAVTFSMDAPPTDADIDEILSDARDSVASQKSPLDIAGSVAKSVMAGPAGLIPENIREAGVQGLLRKPLPETATPGERTAAGIGRVAPAVGMAALAAPLTGGMSFPATLAAEAAMAGAGESLATGVGGLAGGEKPGLVKGSAEIGKQALVGALTGLGVKTVPKIIEKVAPTTLQVFEKIPGEALKRMLARMPDMSNGLKKAAGNQAAVDRFGIKSLRELHLTTETARRTAGGAVDDALKAFPGSIDASSASNALDEVLSTSQIGDEAVAAAIPEGEIKRLREVAKAIAKSPVKTPAQAIALRRAIDGLTSFKKGGVTPVTSDVGQRAARAMGSALRKSIQSAADTAKYTPLSKANANFAKIANAYDEAAEIISTRSGTDLATLKRLDSISNLYYQGGLRREILERLADSIPGAAGPVNDMLDAVAVRAFEKAPAHSPSSVVMNTLRVLGAPRVIGAAARNRETIGGLSRAAVQSAGSESVR